MIYFTTLTQPLLVLLIIILSVEITLAASNVARRAYLEPLAEATLEQCETDGTLDCHTEWVYDGQVLVGFDTIGRQP